MKYSDFTYWFKKKSRSTWIVLNKATHENVGTLHYNHDTDDVSVLGKESNHISEEFEYRIAVDFDSFRERPEYHVGSELGSESLETMKQQYQDLISGCIMIRAEEAGVDPDSEIVQGKINKVLDMLSKSDFYTAPASTRFHESYPSGLLFHTIKVYNQMIDLHNLVKFANVDYCGMTLVALVHDWCKIGLYTPYKRNVKNKDTGRWEEVDAYERGFTYFTHGHQSLEIARSYFKFTNEEKLAITHHMGHWYCHPSEENALQKSNEQFPLVHMIQFADSLSITNY